MSKKQIVITGTRKNGGTTYRFNNKPNNVSIKETHQGYTLILKGNNDTARGSLGNDTLYGDAGSDILVGNEGRDTLIAGTSEPGSANQNQLQGDTDLIRVGKSGFDDSISGGTGCTDRLIGDSLSLYGNGGDDTLLALGNSTEIIGDALDLQASAQGGNDILTGSPIRGSRTTMYGDGINSYGPARGGNDQLISGLSDDFMYGDYQLAFPAPFANDPYIFDIYDQYGFFVPNTGIQPFTYDPVVFDIFNQNVNGSGADANTPSSQTITFDDGTTYVIPARSQSDSTAPIGGSDRFIFKTTDEGNDTIFDFNPSEGDRIVFENSLVFNQIQASSNGRDTRITYGSSSILLPYFTGLTASDFIFSNSMTQPSDNGNWLPVAL